MELTSREAIERVQLKRLQELLATVLGANGFYSRRVGEVPRSLTEFVERVPYTRKQELVEDQSQHPPYGTNLTFPLERYSRYCQTSGTTGMPMRWLDTAESWEWMRGNWRRVFEAAAVRSDDRIFFASSFGPFLGFWLGFEAAAQMGCLCLPGGGLRSAARLEMIIENQATVLCCTPTYAIRLAEAAREEDIDLSKARIRTIVAAGEPGASIPGTRRHISDLWNGARVVDHHGMTETGPVSYGCPRREGVLHVIESAYFPEIIDRGDGEGELVLTPLGRAGSPVLRYRTGDIVRRADSDVCECGSHELALAGGILGRVDDVVVVRGVNVYPGAVENVLRAAGGISEYRVEVRTSGAMLDLHLYVEPVVDRETDVQLGAHLEAALHKAFSLRMPVSVVPAGSLPRFEMKAKRWVRQ